MVFVIDGAHDEVEAGEIDAIAGLDLAVQALVEELAQAELGLLGIDRNAIDRGNAGERASGSSMKSP